MKVSILSTLATLLITSLHSADIPAFFTEPQEAKTEVAPTTAERPLTAFTGRVTRPKVRLRLQPSTDAPVVKELPKGDLVIIDGEKEDFYAVRPPAGSKVYIFRTFVLDNVIEGSRVNVRLYPDQDAPVVVQLNSGDRIKGQLSGPASKWLEIDPPATVRYYVAKELIDKAGDEQFLSTQEKRKAEASALVTNTEAAAQAELQKSFDQVQLQPLLAQYQVVIEKYSDFPEFVKKAQELSQNLQKDYTEKRIAYLEQKAKRADLISEQQGGATSPASNYAIQSSSVVTDKMNAWKTAEQSLINQWMANGHQNGTADDFYAQEKNRAVLVKGMVEPYQRPVKNRPGDYLLVSSSDNRPVAYLYSTRVNLEGMVGHETSLWVVPRANNEFAFPAYYVLETQ